MLLVVPTAEAGTDELCAEQAYGVPGPQPKHPQWWDPGLSPSQRETRWTGASAIYDTGSAAPDLASGRVIWDKPSERLFFEFEVTGDPSVDGDQDIVMLAVSDITGASPDLYIQFRPLRNCTPLSNCTGLGSAVPSTWIEYAQATGGGTSITWSTLSTTNPSTDWTVEHPWVEVRQTGTGASTRYHWKLKFALDIPVDAGTGEAWPNLRLYGNAVMYQPGPTSGTAVEFPLLCEPSSPTANDCLVFSSGTPSLPAALPVANMGTIWSHVTTGSLAACDGVELIRQLVGSDYNTTPGTVPGTTVPYTMPGHQIPKFTGARMRAGFHNDTSLAIGPGDIDADFRIANWGLQWSSWQNATWSYIDSASLVGTVTSGGYAGAFGQGLLQTPSPWVPSTSGLALTNDHQCMHVRLTANAGGINFKRDSVYRNMDLVNASVFRRPVDIDMTGREPPEGQEDNHLFLLVNTKNMPSVEECAEADQQLRGCAEGGPLVLDPGSDVEPIKQFQEVDALPADGAMEAPLDPGAGLTQPAGPAAAPPPVGELEPIGFDKPAPEGVALDELPQLVVYGLVDTGGVIDLPNAEGTPVLRLASAYGYYVQHEGPPSIGVETYVHAPGAEPVEGVGGLYELHVAPDQVVSMANTVRVIDGVQEECISPPDLQDEMPEEEELAKVAELMGPGLEGVLKEEVQEDPQFGCEAPPQRGACALGECLPHSPIAYIEGSRYVGEWDEEVLAAIYEEEIDELMAPADPDEQDGEALDDGLTDELGGTAAGCCAQASVDPEAGRRGTTRLGAMAMLLLLLRRGRRRRRR